MRLWKYYSFPSSPLKRIIIQNFILVNPRLSLDAVRVVGFIKIANFVLAQVALPPDSLVSNKPKKLRLSLDAVRAAGFIKTENSVLAQLAHPPDSLVSE